METSSLGWKSVDQNNMRATTIRRSPHHYLKSNIHNFGNPFRFNVARKSSRVIYGLATAIVVGFLCLGFWLFFSPQFMIRRIQITTNLALPHNNFSELVRTQLQEKRLGVFPGYNLFAFNARQFSARLAELFRVEHVNINKTRPHSLAINITEKPRTALWSSQNRFFALNAQGNILGRVAAPRGDDIIVYDLSGGEVVDGAQVISPNTLTFIAQLKSDPRIIPLGFKFAVMPKPNAMDLTVRVHEGFDINFGITTPLEDQLNNLDITLRHTIAPDTRASLNYIDLRFGSKVYYKYK